MTAKRAILPTLILVTAGLLPACDAPDASARLDELEARFTPGLHAMMQDLGTRHASLWFAGDAENWALASYMIHELEEVTGDIETLHPEYDGVQVEAMLREMTTPAIEEIEAAIEAGDRAAFAAAFDRLTTACNQCHTAADRTAIVIQRPIAPPQSNLRYQL
jgi:hypothetical protein